MMRNLCLAVLLLLGGLPLQAQDGDLLLQDDVYHQLDRYDIQGRLPYALPTSLKPYGREMVTQWLSDADTTGMRRRASQWHERSRILIDDRYAAEKGMWGVWNVFFTNKRDLLGWVSPETTKVKASLAINPVMNVHYGLESTSLNDNELRSVYQNTRGASLRASLFDKVGIYTELTDNQIQVPLFSTALIEGRQAIPGEGFYKRFKTEGYDYLGARGYITYSPVKQVRIKLGRDRMHWGDGYQSMVLSDHAVDAYMLNIHTRIWKLEYMNHFTQLIDYIPGKPDAVGTQPRKYGVFHHLAYRPAKNLSIGFFESVIYAPILPNGRRGFELQYLNPIIFYRTVEQYIGSPDNSTLGLTFKGNFFKRLQLYSQIMIDDYNFGQRKNGSGWWGNKWALQGGLKYVDVLGVETLDLQLEANTARPYTYSHYNTSANYASYNQPLAHPQGANFSEITGILRYRPLSRLYMQATATVLMQGLDQNGLNMGGDIFRSNLSRPASLDFGNTIGQGTPYRMTQLQGRMSYQIWWLNAFVDAELFLRTSQIEGLDSQQSIWATLGLRWNLPHRQLRY